MKIRMMSLALGMLLMGACSGLGSSPVKQFTKGEEIAFYDFTTPASFEEGSYGNNTARLQITDGVYNIQLSAGDSTLYYGQWGATLGDVIIDVEAVQTSADLNSTYGVMCRARGAVGQTSAGEATAEATESAGTDNIVALPDSEATAEATLGLPPEATAESTASTPQEAPLEITPTETAEATAQAGISNATSDNTSNNGDGYLFMVQGNGRFAILRSQGRKITPLVNWATSSAVNSGAAQNRIRAVCMGTYLAMYVNGQFVADTTDDLYTKGQVALVGASAGRTGMAVTFDNLSVSDVKAGS